jgi:ABC-type glutathione transport system ATPase component
MNEPLLQVTNVSCSYLTRVRKPVLHDISFEIGEHGREERARVIDEMLEVVGLDPGYKNRAPRELSSGQKQRVSIAAALMLQPRLLVADEPVSALDVSVSAQILNLFRNLNHRLGLSLLFIAHNLNMVYYLCDRIAVMKDGRIVETGTAEDVYLHPQDAYTKELLAAVPNR